MLWPSKHELWLEARLASIEQRHAAELTAQAERLGRESQALHERDEAEIKRLLGELVALQGRYHMLELSVFSASSPAGAQFANRVEPQPEGPQEPMVESEQGTPWQRVQRREIKRLEEEFFAAQKKTAELHLSGKVPLPRPENDLASGAK